jgi:hypothetical protein
MLGISPMETNSSPVYSFLEMTNPMLTSEGKLTFLKDYTSLWRATSIFHFNAYGLNTYQVALQATNEEWWT